MAVFMSCSALIFFGVPNRGLDHPSLTTMVKGQPNEDLVRNLDPSSPFLSQLHSMFYEHFTFDDSKILCFYETKMTPTVEVSFQPLSDVLAQSFNSLSSVVSGNRHLGTDRTQSHDGAPSFR